jgi:uncharacterized protein
VASKTVDQLNQIIWHKDYQYYLGQNEKAESERIFCGHCFDHFLSVARLTYIFLLEEDNHFITREMAYAAGLLHDLGRWCEYSSGIDHAEASVKLAVPILNDAGFSKDESALILKAIRQHRLSDDIDQHRSPLSRALKKADLFSRLCFQCQAQNECYKFEKQPHKKGLEY